jgi:hypothetical protein
MPFTFEVRSHPTFHVFSVAEMALVFVYGVSYQKHANEIANPQTLICEP